MSGFNKEQLLSIIEAVAQDQAESLKMKDYFVDIEAKSNCTIIKHFAKRSIEMVDNWISGFAYDESYWKEQLAELEKQEGRDGQ